MLKISKRPIVIQYGKVKKEDNKGKIDILTVQKKIYGLFYLKKQNKYDNISLNHEKGFEIAIESFIRKTTEKEYTSPEVAKEIAKKRTEQIIKDYETAIKNPRGHGHFNKITDEKEQSKIKDILKENNTPYETIEKLFNLNSVESGTQKAKKENKNKDKNNSKLLSGYYNKEGKRIKYSDLISLDKFAKKQLSIDLEDYYYVSYNPEDEKTYLYDFDEKSYMKIDKKALQDFLARKEDIRLDTNDTNKLIESIVKRIENNYDYIEFQNKLFNLKTYEYEDKTVETILKGKKYETRKPRPFITPKKIHYNLLETPDENFNPDNSILYKSLEQILGTNENVKDFKQRIGSTIFNKGKNITIYFNPEGDNGKSLLVFIMVLVLGQLVRNTNPNQLESNFIQNLINHIHGLIFDETKAEAFKETEDKLKKTTGGGTTEESRKIQTDDIISVKINSHVFIFTNPLPAFNLNDTALFKRISIVKLPNRFTYNENEVDYKTIFPINDNLEDEIKKDNEGIEHFIYECIQEFKQMEGTFINKKGVEYARAFYLTNDHLMNFINLYTKITKHETENTTATEITNNYKEYLENNNIDLILPDDYYMEVGRRLSKFYGKNNIKRGRNSANQRIMTNIKCNYITGTEPTYFVSENLEDYNILDNDFSKIFELIKKGYNTFEKLKTQVKEHEKILEALNYLKKQCYIIEQNTLKTNR